MSNIAELKLSLRDGITVLLFIISGTSAYMASHYTMADHEKRVTKLESADPSGLKIKVENIEKTVNKIDERLEKIYDKINSFSSPR